MKNENEKKYLKNILYSKEIFSQLFKIIKIYFYHYQAVMSHERLEDNWDVDVLLTKIATGGEPTALAAEGEAKLAEGPTGEGEGGGVGEGEGEGEGQGTGQGALQKCATKKQKASPRFSALIDTGALITGYSNYEG